MNKANRLISSLAVLVYLTCAYSVVVVHSAGYVIPGIIAGVVLIGSAGVALSRAGKGN